MMAPPEVELVLDGIFGGLLQRKAQRLAVQTKMAGFTARFVGAALSHGSLPRWNVTASRAVHSTLPIQPVEVIVHQEASHHLGVGEADTFWVWFGAATPDSGVTTGSVCLTLMPAKLGGRYCTKARAEARL